MASVTESEVVPGLVVHVDTDELRKLGGSSTNAEVAHGQDRAVRGPHYFLVVAQVPGDPPRCLAVPLFSKRAPGSELLDEVLKSGLSDDWIDIDSYYSKWQHWLIPVSAVAAASSSDRSESSDRRRFARGQPDELNEIAGWSRKNRAPWRSA